MVEGWRAGPTVSVLVTAILDTDNAADPVSDNESRLNDLKPWLAVATKIYENYLLFG